MHFFLCPETGCGKVSTCLCFAKKVSTYSLLGGTLDVDTFEQIQISKSSNAKHAAEEATRRHFSRKAKGSLRSIFQFILTLTLFRISGNAKVSTSSVLPEHLRR